MVLVSWMNQSKKTHDNPKGVWIPEGFRPPQVGRLLVL
jgi:hypothetical protein